MWFRWYSTELGWTLAKWGKGHFSKESKQHSETTMKLSPSHCLMPQKHHLLNCFLLSAASFLNDLGTVSFQPCRTAFQSSQQTASRMSCWKSAWLTNLKCHPQNKGKLASGLSDSVSKHMYVWWNHWHLNKTFSGVIQKQNLLALLKGKSIIDIL